MKLKFNVTIKKLKKGWDLTLPLLSQKEGKTLIKDLQANDRMETDSTKRLKKLKGKIVKSKKSLFMKVYRPKLKQCLDLVYIQFKSHRDLAVEK